MIRTVLYFLFLVAVVSVSAQIDDYFKESTRDRTGMMKSFEISVRGIFLQDRRDISNDVPGSPSNEIN